jgi:hypothetical protein
MVAGWHAGYRADEFFRTGLNLLRVRIVRDLSH